MSRLKVEQIQDRSGSGISLDASLKFKQYTTSQIDALRSLNKHIHRKEAQLESFEVWLDKEMTK